MELCLKKKSIIKPDFAFQKQKCRFYGQTAFLGIPAFTSLFVLNCCFSFVLGKNHVSTQCSFFPLYNKILIMFPLLLSWGYLSSNAPHWEEKPCVWF